jgi:hypothetical protein
VTDSNRLCVLEDMLKFARGKRKSQGRLTKQLVQCDTSNKSQGRLTKQLVQCDTSNKNVHCDKNRDSPQLLSLF